VPALCLPADLAESSKVRRFQKIHPINMDGLIDNIDQHC
jgi:hypothetical protein